MMIAVLLLVLVVAAVSVTAAHRAAERARRFEDDIQLQSAIKADCSHLFTRDLTHFHSTAVAVVPPSSFVLNGL